MATEKEKNELLKSYFNAVTPEDIIMFDSAGRVFIDDKLLSQGELNTLIAEAKQMAETRLYKILTNYIKKRAMEVMYMKSENFEDMRNGKMMLYNISLQEDIVNRLKKIGKS